MALIPPPSTPVLLYLGAGYDLSPLLTFSPNPPYCITPRPQTTYTSFLFVDAKPRKTSAFMVPDYEEWLDVPARVRNVIKYSQGMLERWCLIRTSEQHGDTDVIWFEGGGFPAHVDSRRADPQWHWTTVLPRPSCAQSTYDHHAPLTTLIYAFNTLEIELARIPALIRVWPCVTALYVHGLRPHPVTGLDRLIATQGKQGGGASVGDEIATTITLKSNLQHVYVLVGSWGTPRHGRARGAGAQRGARHVDFVKAGWREWRKRMRKDTDKNGEPMSTAPLVISSSRKGTFNPRDTLHLYVSGIVSESDSDSDSDMGNSPLVFRRAHSLDSEDDQWSAASDDEYWTGSGASASPMLGLTTALDSSWQASHTFISPRFSTVHVTRASIKSSFHQCSPSAPESFYTRIPQIAWDDTLNSGLGGYYIAKTIEESLAVWRARAEGPLETEGEESADEDEMRGPYIKPGDIPRGTTENFLKNINHSCHETNETLTQSHPSRLHLRPRSPQAGGRHASTRAGCPASPSSASASDVEIDEDDMRPVRSRWSCWRQGASLSGTPLSLFSGRPGLNPRRLRERRMGLSDFLRSPDPSPYTSHGKKARSCPDLKDTRQSTRGAHGRSFSAMRIHHAIATLGRKGRRTSTGAHGTGARAVRHAPLILPFPANVSTTLPTPPSSTPPSPPTKSYRSKLVTIHHKPKFNPPEGPKSIIQRKLPRTFRTIEQENDLFSWLGVGKPTKTRPGVDSYEENNMTRSADQAC